MKRWWVEIAFVLYIAATLAYGRWRVPQMAGAPLQHDSWNGALVLSAPIWAPFSLATGGVYWLLMKVGGPVTAEARERQSLFYGTRY